MWYQGLAPLDVVVLIAICAAAAGVALVLMGRFGAKKAADPSPAPATAPEVALLFRGAVLVDASPSAQRLLKMGRPGKTDLEQALNALAPRFPDLRQRLKAESPPSKEVLEDIAGFGVLSLERTQRSVRMTVSGEGASALDGQVAATLVRELEILRDVSDQIGIPQWRQTHGGQVVWTNAAYDRLAQEFDLGDAGSLFENQLDLGGDLGHAQRVRLEGSEPAKTQWFEVQFAHSGKDIIATAVPTNKVVQAERSLSAFVQTLTQTFAHLNVGLAVFNRNRELAIFNPALSDLLELQPEFLVTHPSLFQMFDRLREQRMVPETKDYKSWRRRMAALEAVVADGVHSEIWHLSDGRTIRVTGRPHPEGAIAFLFEDISEEIALERKFRGELKMGQSLIDGLDEAIAVFSISGALTLCNRAFRELWFDGLEADALPQTLVETSRVWQHGTEATPVWGDLRDFAGRYDERSNWEATVQMTDGTELECRFDTLSGGYTLTGFSRAMPAPIHSLHGSGSDERLRA